MKAKTQLPEVPVALRDAALIDGPTCAATGRVSVSWWNDRVARGEAPQPVIRGQRFTRWRAIDVAAFWRDLAERGTDDGIVQRAKKASRAASAKRQAAQAGA